MKMLRNENGTEYEPYESNEFCREVVIKRETMISYTLENDGAPKKEESNNHGIHTWHDLCSRSTEILEGRSYQHYHICSK